MGTFKYDSLLTKSMVLMGYLLSFFFFFFTCYSRKGKEKQWGQWKMVLRSMNFMLGTFRLKEGFKQNRSTVKHVNLDTARAAHELSGWKNQWRFCARPCISVQRSWHRAHHFASGEDVGNFPGKTSYARPSSCSSKQHKNINKIFSKTWISFFRTGKYCCT